MPQSIRARLLVVILLPLCLLGFNGVKSFIDDTETTSEMAVIQSLTELASHTSAVIHETQKERGYTAGFLKSGGRLFTSELPEQRTATDSKVATLQEYLEDFDMETFGVEGARAFKSGLAHLGDIQNKRTAITARSIKPSEGIGYYTNMHAEFITAIASMSHESGDASISGSINSFAMFLRGKELAGVERALLNGALASNSLRGSELKKLSEIVSKQSEYFAIFKAAATSEENGFFKDAMGKPAAKVAEDMVADTFELALHNEKPAIYRELTSSLALSGPLGSAVQTGDGLQGAIAQVLGHLDDYSKLQGLPQSSKDQISTLRTLLGDLPSALDGAGGSKFNDWSEQVSSAMGTLETDKDHLDSELTASKWFAASTARLGLLKEVEVGLAQSLTSNATQVGSSAGTSKLINGIVGLLSIALVAGVGYQIFKSVTHRINFMVENIERVDTQRDLSLRINDSGRDELTQISTSFDKLVGSLQSILSDVDNVSNSLADGAKQVGSSSQSLAVGATQQAANLQSINTQVGSILEQTKSNTGSAQTASSLAQNSEVSAGKGMEQMNNMSEAMDEISASSERIADIIKTIDGLAFQTNLLALNANVEAARAGEAGKGFAVVAEEVRSLAQRSAQAASDTASVITESTQCAQKGVAIAAQARLALEEISESTNQVNEILSGIATASQEQTEAIGNVNRGLTELDEVTQYNAAHSEELAAAADQTAGECRTLEGLVAQFKLGSNEASRLQRATPPAAQPKTNSDPKLQQTLAPAGKAASPPSIKPSAPAPAPEAKCLSFDDADFDHELESF